MNAEVMSKKELLPWEFGHGEHIEIKHFGIFQSALISWKGVRNGKHIPNLAQAHRRKSRVVADSSRW